MSVYDKISQGAYNVDPLKFPFGNWHSPERDAYERQERALLAQFWLDVVDEYWEPWITDKQWKKIKSFAWDHGHAGGLSDVLYWVIEAVELMRDNA